jgi:hypothetical protein
MFKNGKTAAETKPASSVEIVPLAEAPGFADADRIRRVLEDAYDREASAFELLRLEHQLRGKRPTDVGMKGGLLHQRRNALREKINRRKEPAPAAAPAAQPEIAAALALIEGGRPGAAQDQEAREAEARRRLEIFAAGIGAARDAWDEMRQEASRAAAAALVPHHRRILRSLLEAMRAVVKATEEEQALRARFASAGYDLDRVLDLVAMPPTPSARAMGTEARLDSEIELYRLWLERMVAQ